jgi:ferredoxin
VAKIARTAKKDEGKTRATLERMVDKAVIFKKTVSEAGQDQELYSILPTAPGLWELTFARKEKNPRTQQLARLWREYYKSGWGKEMHRIKTPVTRVFPVERSLSSNLEVLPYERASELLKTADFFSVLHCACRSAAELAGEGCGKPTDVCLMFGDFARFMVERDCARQIDMEEALAVLKRTEEASLVHLTMNSRDAVLGICSCCSCCCTQLRAISYLPKPSAVAKSRYVPVVDLDECTACEICEERCQVAAVKVVDETALVDRERCIGCGLCVTACPTEAISLEEREIYEEPLPTIQKLTETIIREKAQP